MQINKYGIDGPRYCCRKCYGLASREPRHTVVCAQCNKPKHMLDGQLRQHANHKSKHHFCSLRCSGLYGAAHKTTGSQRSKLEIWLEERLLFLYPQLYIRFNDRVAIQSELDIHIPSLNLAFELNGPVHYEPIFGQDKLARTQQRDRHKMHACTDHGIDLCVIDVSGRKYFKPEFSEYVLGLVVQTINSRISADTVNASIGTVPKTDALSLLSKQKPA